VRVVSVLISVRVLQPIRLEGRSRVERTADALTTDRWPPPLLVTALRETGNGRWVGEAPLLCGGAPSASICSQRSRSTHTYTTMQRKTCPRPYLDASRSRQAIVVSKNTCFGASSATAATALPPRLRGLADARKGAHLCHQQILEGGGELEGRCRIRCIIALYERLHFLFLVLRVLCLASLSLHGIKGFVIPTTSFVKIGITKTFCYNN